MNTSSALSLQESLLQACCICDRIPPKMFVGSVSGTMLWLWTDAGTPKLCLIALRFSPKARTLGAFVEAETRPRTASQHGCRRGALLGCVRASSAFHIRSRNKVSKALRVELMA